MTMRFKIGFTITAETMFGLLAKFLPVEDLSVEEIVERPPAALKAQPSARLLEPRRKRAKAPRRGLNLTDGVNSIIMALLVDGQPHRPGELKPLLEAKSYSVNGLGSRLERLKAHGLVFQQIGRAHV